MKTVIPIATLTQIAKPAYGDDSWEEWFNDDNEATKRHVAKLIDDKGEEEFFDSPIVVSRDDDGTLRVVDGMHRMKAHHILGSYDVIVEFDDDTHDDDLEDFTFILVETEMDATNDDLFDESLYAMSFRLSTEQWLNWMITTGSDIGHDFYLTSNEDISQVNIGTIAADVQQSFGDLDVLVRKVSYCYDDGTTDDHVVLSTWEGQG